MATCSFGPAVAAAKCQARRSGSTCASVASANAKWAARRSVAAADLYTAERTSGCRKVTRWSIASNPSSMRVRGFRRDRQPLARPPQQHRVADRLRRRRPAADAELRRRADQVAERSSPRSVLSAPARSAGRIRRRTPWPSIPVAARESQRIAPSLSDDVVPDTLIHLERHHRAQQCSGVASTKPSTSRTGRSRSATPGSRGGEDDPDRLGQQATGDKAQASAPRSHPATARRRPDTAADAAQRPPRTGSTPPARGRKRSGASPVFRPNTTSMAWRCGVGMPLESDRAAGRTAGGDRRNRAPSPTPPPPPGRR